MSRSLFLASDLDLKAIDSDAPLSCHPKSRSLQLTPGKFHDSNANKLVSASQQSKLFVIYNRAEWQGIYLWMISDWTQSLNSNQNLSRKMVKPFDRLVGPEATR